VNIEPAHLDIEELLGEASGTPLKEEAKAHLADCPACRSDAQRWATVARGVRRLVAATPAPANCLPDDGSSGHSSTPGNSDQHDWRPTRRRRLPRRAFLGGAAAAVLVIAAGSYGLAAGFGGASPRPATSGGPRTVSAGLIAVTGCPALDATSGTLEQVNGPDLVIKTSDGQSVTVATAASTKVSREVSGSLDDIHDGAQVIVESTEPNGTTVAQSVGVGMGSVVGKLKQLPIPPVLPVKVGGPGIGPQLGLASGIVVDASSGGFTVVEPDGARVPVTTTSSTTVTVLSAAAIGNLETGEFTVAVGTSGTSGTLEADSVEQEAVSQSVLPNGRLPLPGIGRGGGIAGLPNFGCSASTVATATLLAAG
jgi:hypothetical protein